MLHHFQPAKNIALGIGDGFALLGAEHSGDARRMLADQRLQLEHDAHPRADRGVSPGQKGALSGGHRGVDFARRRKRHLGQHLLSRRIDDVEPLSALRFDPFAVDQHSDPLDGWVRCVVHKVLRLIIVISTAP